MAQTKENLQLTKTLIVNTDEYDINAVHSDTADKATHAELAEIAKKVENTLTINTKAVDEANNKTFTFDGSQQNVSIDIVPADGGRFLGPIQVPTTEVIADNSVLNYQDITETVLTRLINNSTVYEWADDNLNSTGTQEGTINGISIIIGKESDLDAFVTKNNENNGKLRICSYLYICKENGNLYYGEAAIGENAGSVTQLAVIADKLKDEHTFITDLTKTEADSFDGSSNTEIGIKGILPVINGGTGEDSLTKVKVGMATEADKLVLSDGSFITAQDVKDAQEDINKITSGTTVVSKAEKDINGLPIHFNYYRSNIEDKSVTSNANLITISTSEPSGGSNGDIWIVYKKQ